MQNKDPEIIIYIAIKKPKDYGYQAIAPYTKEIISNIAKYRNMYSDVEEKKTSIQKYTMNNYINSKTLIANNELTSYKMKFSFISSTS